MITEDEIESIQACLFHLDQVASEFEGDKPRYADKIRRFRKEKKEELDDLASQMYQVWNEIENYPPSLEGCDEQE